MTKNITDELHLLRSILHSDDHFQIRLSEDFNQICLKLDYDIQISFFIDSNNPSIKSITINNIHDLRIDKLTTKSSLKYDQWINIRDYFNKLIQQSNSNTSIYSIIQLIQENILQICKSNDKQSISNENASTSIQKFHGADLIYNTKIDHSQVLILTGNEITENPNLIQGMYHFNQSTNQWNLCSNVLSLSSDDLKIPSIDPMYIPEHCQFVTWNIFSSEDFYSNERYKEILKTLKSFLPDIICLQEVTNNFLNILLDEIWLKENNYYIIITRNILDNNQNKSCRELMLMKNIRPRAFSICSFHLSKEKEYIIARFELNSKITIDIINLHLYKSNEKISEELEYLFKQMNTQNYMIIGDFNFGDEDLIEENIIQKYKYQIHDLWKDIYDNEEVILNFNIR